MLRRFVDPASHRAAKLLAHAIVLTLVGAPFVPASATTVPTLDHTMSGFGPGWVRLNVTLDGTTYMQDYLELELYGRQAAVAVLTIDPSGNVASFFRASSEDLFPSWIEVRSDAAPVKVRSQTLNARPPVFDPSETGRGCFPGPCYSGNWSYVLLIGGQVGTWTWGSRHYGGAATAGEVAQGTDIVYARADAFNSIVMAHAPGVTVNVGGAVEHDASGTLYGLFDPGIGAVGLVHRDGDMTRQCSVSQYNPAAAMCIFAEPVGEGARYQYSLDGYSPAGVGFESTMLLVASID